MSMSTANVSALTRSVKFQIAPPALSYLNGVPERSSTPAASHCRVDAGGVPAEWVEATAATEGQPTFVYFLSGGYGGDALEQSRPSAERLALASGARVLTVACSPPHAVAIEAGIAAYAWLIGEGCDVDRTMFVHDTSAASVVDAIVVEASTRGLPVPDIRVHRATLAG
jgi:acetyl esterase/lipase